VSEKTPRKSTPRKPAKKAAPRKAAAKTPPRKTTPTKADREAAAQQLASVTSIVDRSRTQRETGGRHPSQTKTTKEALALHERRNRALAYRRAGLSWVQVAENVSNDLDLPSYAPSTAQTDVRSLTDQITVENVNALREDDLALLLSLQRKVYSKALDGDLKASREMRGILADRAKYLGLYAPVRHELAAAVDVDAHVSIEDPASVYAAAMEALVDLLPPAESPQIPELPGRSS
jgi:hypothetical protein